MVQYYCAGVCGIGQAQGVYRQTKSGVLEVEALKI